MNLNVCDCINRFCLSSIKRFVCGFSSPGECISGALAWQELMELSCQVGFAPPILVDVAPIAIEDPKLKEVVGK